MGRVSLLSVAVAWAAVAVGCTHCDTCDNFPTPCNGGDCGAAAPGPPGGYSMMPTMGYAPEMPVGPGAPPAVYSSPMPGAMPANPAPAMPQPTRAAEPAGAPAPSTTPSPFSDSSATPPPPMSMGNPINPKS